MTPAILIIFLPFMVLSCPLSDNICRYGTASNRNSTRLLAAQYKLLVSPTYSSLVSPVHPVSPVNTVNPIQCQPKYTLRGYTLPSPA